MEHITIFEVFQHLIDTLKEDFFKPFELLIHYFSFIYNNEPVEVLEVLYLLF